MDAIQSDLVRDGETFVVYIFKDKGGGIALFQPSDRQVPCVFYSHFSPIERLLILSSILFGTDEVYYCLIADNAVFHVVGVTGYTSFMFSIEIFGLVVDVDVVGVVEQDDEKEQVFAQIELFGASDMMTLDERPPDGFCP